MSTNAPPLESSPLLTLIGAAQRELPATEDLLAACLPLLRQVAELHAQGLVAPLDGIDELRVTAGRIWFENAKARPIRRGGDAVDALGRQAQRGALEVAAHYVRTEQDGAYAFESVSIGRRGVAPERPVYLPGFVSWEHELGHHDPLCDVFVLGLVLAALGTGLDLSDEGDLRSFVAQREDLRALNPALHPVAALVIARMTELDRHRRQQDLNEVIGALERRRDQDALRAVDLTAFRGFVSSASAGRRDAILGHLQSRLYDRSRRNRLLYFRATTGSLNLTVASVPLVLDAKNIDPNGLVTWGGSFADQVVAQKPLALAKWLRFEDYPYIAPALDRVRLDAARDAAEYGFSQLRLVVCFLHWHDLKNAAEERISSPLLLLPVRVSKKKGVRDAHVIEAVSELAEVNPVLRHHLRQLYGLVLPESVDLGEPGVLDELKRVLAEQISASEPGVVLEKRERPRIDLVQAIARRRLQLHQRRARLTGRGVRSLHGFDYAYGRERRVPLGVQLFVHVVSPSAAPQRELLEAPKPRIFRLEPDVREIEQQQYRLQDAGDGASPYRWVFDLCSVTLANFNYRKMSLVGDYAAMLREPRPSPTFDTLFPKEARPLAPEVTAPALAERFSVVDGDPTQNHAIAVARAQASFIIQGPPGTGKSQTIANLIADYLARGKRVLFVCEKRAAIDVVYHRLEQQGLGRLCCVIHDSQEDKKAFVYALRDAYQSWIDGAPEAEAERARGSALARVQNEQGKLERFALEMSAPAAGAELALVALMRRCIALGPPPELTEPLRALVPEHAPFAQHAAALQRISDDLRRIGADPVLARHPARLLRAAPLTGPQALEQLRGQLQRSQEQLVAVAQGPREQALPLFAIGERASLARAVLPLARARLLPLLNAASDLHHRVRTAVLELERRRDALRAAEGDARGWRSPLRRDEAENALALARKHDGSWLRFLFPSFWRLRGLLHERFDFASWAIAPSFSALLERLVARYEAERQVDERARALAEDTGVEDVVPLFELAAQLQQPGVDPHQRRLRDALIAGDAEEVAGLPRLAGFAAAAEEIDRVLVEWRHLTPAALLAELAQLERGLARLPDALPILHAVDALPPALAVAARVLPLELERLEAAVCHQAVHASAGVRRGDIDGAALESAHDALVQAHAGVRRANAALIVEQARARFLEHVRISGTPAAGLEPGQKPFKKTYAAGRRELEHEFGKVMRFRPIRDLVADEPGAVVRDLKPVWLMSPLSVADTLPLAADFDVVVVDEASQIPLEDALPALERGRQIIVVGDEKQLPPTAFFSARGEDDDEEEREPELAALDADSLLDHAARALPATMLGWHYRSRDETLISFCNQAFYDGRLLTAPSVKRLRPLPEIRAAQTQAGAAGAQALLDRSLSFHRMEGAVYAQRCNVHEAGYIAELVRALLARETKLSLGVVAFSEAQQATIEAAIQRLADDDPEFRARYEAELERVDAGQFNGMFVKNLENVQGDERDVMVLSVCYGPDAAGKMAMNFGPINQRGGERRLNVIFSRAKLHMAVVSSIDWTQITNDYNDGAACLKAYLRYAAASSRGDATEAGAVLDGLARARGAVAAAAQPDPLALDLAQVLRDKGWEVELDVGASRFRCDLAVRAKGEAQYRLGVLIDGEAHYANSDLDDRYRLKPAVMRAFGWKLCWVLTRDWLLDRAGVIARVESALR